MTLFTLKGDDVVPIDIEELLVDNVYAYFWNNVWEWGNGERAYLMANAGYKVSCWHNRICHTVIFHRCFTAHPPIQCLPPDPVFTSHPDTVFTVPPPIQKFTTHPRSSIYRPTPDPVFTTHPRPTVYRPTPDPVFTTHPRSSIYRPTPDPEVYRPPPIQYLPPHPRSSFYRYLKCHVIQPVSITTQGEGLSQGVWHGYITLYLKGCGTDI